VRASDLLSIASVIALGFALLALTGAELWRGSARRAATLALVRQASGLTLTRRESGRLMAAIQTVTTHYNGRDVREPPPEIDISLACHPGTRLRVEYRPKPPHYAAVVLTGE
jgi:hypothetical protein